VTGGASEREAAIQAAVEVVRDFEANGGGHRGRKPPRSSVAALENHLGPLDWSFDGEGFRLLREVAARLGFGGRTSSPDPAEERALCLYDATARARRCAHRVAVPEEWGSE